MCRQLVGRLARKRPSPLTRGDTQIWAPGAIYAVGQVNFLFDRSQRPHMTADQLAACLGVIKTTMANKAALINRTLNLGAFEPDLTTTAMLEQHPLAWLVEVDGVIVDARMLPLGLQDAALRRGLIPDLDHHRAHDRDSPAAWAGRAPRSSPQRTTHTAMIAAPPAWRGGEATRDDVAERQQRLFAEPAL